jgi:hypothetical protein
MGLGNLNKIEQETHRRPVLLKVDGHRNIGLVVRRCPRVCRKAEGTIMFLEGKSVLFYSDAVLMNSYLKYFGNPTPNLYEHLLDVA